MFLPNTLPHHRQPLLPDDDVWLGRRAADEVNGYLAHCPVHAPTPLHDLRGLAQELGVGSVAVKDEGRRLGLGSFKALGGGYAVIRLVLEEAERRLGRRVDASGLRSPEVRAVASTLTVGCATDGNHGRAVAAGARLAGARAAIFVHQGVSAGRVEAIASFGAQVIRVRGTYDDAVAEAARRCAREGWTVVSDTAWPGYERIPLMVMQGYTVIVREALRALAAPPTHLFVQAGVGGLAAAAAGHLAALLGERRPTVVVVEPARAACLLESARAGRPVQIAPGSPTVMAMLECYQPSLVAWRVLERAADAFLTVDETDAVDMVRRLAHPRGADPAVAAGESGAAGLAGLVRAAGNPQARAALALDGGSRVLAICTEGVLDRG